MTAPATMTACIGEPISWPRLERFALSGASGPDPDIAAHLDACPACRGCLSEIQSDLVALPAIDFSRAALKPRRRWWQLAIPAFGAALAAAIAIIVITRPAPELPASPASVRLAGIKGIGDVDVVLVRERAGAVRDDVATFSPGDRWKVVVTCGAAAGAWLDLTVDDGTSAQPDRPLPRTHVACGNAVPMPGAFEITGARENRVCVRAADDASGLDLRAMPHDPACITLQPDRDRPN